MNLTVMIIIKLGFQSQISNNPKTLSYLPSSSSRHWYLTVGKLKMTPPCHVLSCCISMDNSQSGTFKRLWSVSPSHGEVPYHCIASSWIVCFGVNHNALGHTNISSLVDKNMADTIYTIYTREHVD